MPVSFFRYLKKWLLKASWGMTTPRVCWRWIKTGLIRLARLHRFGEGVVDFEDGVFGDVAAGLDHFAGGVGFLGAGLVPALCNGEGIHDVGHGIAGFREGLR